MKFSTVLSLHPPPLWAIGRIRISLIIKITRSPSSLPRPIESFFLREMLQVCLMTVSGKFATTDLQNGLVWLGEKEGEIIRRVLRWWESIIVSFFLSENLDKFETFGVADRSQNLTLITDSIKARGCRLGLKSDDPANKRPNSVVTLQVQARWA